MGRSVNTAKGAAGKGGFSPAANRAAPAKAGHHASLLNQPPKTRANTAAFPIWKSKGYVYANSDMAGSRSGNGGARVQDDTASLAAGFQRIKAEEGLSRTDILRAYARYSPDLGDKMLLSEFMALGLYNQAEVAPGFIGAKEAALFARRMNFQTHKRGLVADKLLFDGALRGLGFPVAPLQAVFGAKILPPPVHSLQNRNDIGRFLLHEAQYPLFGKPLSGQNSDDVISIDAADPATRRLRLATGESIDLHAAVALIAPKYFRWGYLFQSRIPQHATLSDAIGPTIGSFRVITVLSEATPRVIGAIWKIPVRGMVADNLWRGAMIAEVNHETGQIGHVRTGIGPASGRCPTHPDTHQMIEGLAVPHWPDLIACVTTASGLLSGLPLVGWDVAISGAGPVIIEANTSPSLDLLQYASRTPALAPALRDEMLAEHARLQRQQKKSHKQSRQRLNAKIRARLGRALGLGRK